MEHINKLNERISYFTGRIKNLKLSNNPVSLVIIEDHKKRLDNLIAIRDQHLDDLNINKAKSIEQVPEKITERILLIQKLKEQQTKEQQQPEQKEEPVQEQKEEPVQEQKEEPAQKQTDNINNSEPNLDDINIPEFVEQPVKTPVEKPVNPVENNDNIINPEH